MARRQGRSWDSRREQDDRLHLPASRGVAQCGYGLPMDSPLVSNGVSVAPRPCSHAGGVLAPCRTRLRSGCRLPARPYCARRCAPATPPHASPAVPWAWVSRERTARRQRCGEEGRRTMRMGSSREATVVSGWTSRCSLAKRQTPLWNRKVSCCPWTCAKKVRRVGIGGEFEGPQNARRLINGSAITCMP